MILEVLIATMRGSEMQSILSVEAIANTGLVGDRYVIDLNRNGDDYRVTLIESEEIERYTLEYGKSFSASDMRRNLVTRGVRLNELVGQRFSVGNTVVLEGIEVCEPCSLLACRTDKSIVKDMLHRGGLRARICVGGTISVNDTIRSMS